MGPQDSVKPPKANDEIETVLLLVTGKKRFAFGIGQAIEDLFKMNVYPSEIGMDLLVLAAHVHAADTRILRNSDSQDGWSREIRLIVPVSDVSRWQAVARLLEEMLTFLTGDHWIIGFRARPKGFAQIVPARPANTPEPIFDRLNLFSGGLDSLIGGIEALEAGGIPLFISHAGEGAVSRAQSACYEGLVAAYGQKRLARLRVSMKFSVDLVKGGGHEETTRGRSFQFFAAAVFAGSGFHAPFTVNVPENGFIALNVPLDPLRLGALSTRTTHPFYMARWNELIAALGITGRVYNPHWNQTKGEMVAVCHNAPLLMSLVKSSISCSSPAKGRFARHAAGHCGYCLPCIIRRAALQPADPTHYESPLQGRPLNTRTAKGKQVRSFQFAVQRLSAKPQLAAILIHKAGPLGDEPAHLNELADVYRRGLTEVGALLQGVIAKPR
jgi:hypothetical protein